MTIVECRRIISNRYPKYTKTGADFHTTYLLGICDKGGLNRFYWVTTTIYNQLLYKTMLYNFTQYEYGTQQA